MEFATFFVGRHGEEALGKEMDGQGSLLMEFPPLGTIGDRLVVTSTFFSSTYYVVGHLQSYVDSRPVRDRWPGPRPTPVIGYAQF